ncbi:MAG: 4Fe-4S dicluster domain-containing protein [Bacteroidales bacterium]|nr:4Fe-4S dicluster domain-containing protein [Bacteroidales bacterium]MCF8352159.1 4Fe-4S dicluster domain-containing protein [Bacteroidales bacterium]MCF8377455.1 4Fe-4S dicluster domain-containing protein [Bacteroidales bacterium]MCF8401548.1 4Fe-4S dicluster domain-containing protein [Bacteroidales bacterium]
MIYLQIFGGLLVIFSLWFSLLSFRENEKRAGWLFLIPLVLFSVLYFGLPIWVEGAFILLLILSVLIGLTTFILFLPIDPYRLTHGLMPGKQIDERDTMFSRRELKPGSERFEKYYETHPEKRKADDEFRKKPGLLSAKALHYHALGFAAAESSFNTVAHFSRHVTGPVAGEKKAIDPDVLTRFLKNWSRKLGALHFGICELDEHHWYSVKGRGAEYDAPISQEHKYGIAITVEMRKEMVDTGPKAGIVMESGQQYLEAGRIAMQLAAFLRELGHDARAHIDGNYRVVCPLVARDAGLGEIGRMGLLMSPVHGPRVRIAVVTTNVPLQVSKAKRDASVEHFCKICKKCAHICPSRSISFEPYQVVEGVKRWQIDSESCFNYWCIVGTDCAQCMRVCPYSHPDNLMHNIIRWGIRHSHLFRYFALKMDDVFYGKRPKPKPLPGWMGG